MLQDIVKFGEAPVICQIHRNHQNAHYTVHSATLLVTVVMVMLLCI